MYRRFDTGSLEGHRGNRTGDSAADDEGPFDVCHSASFHSNSGQFLRPAGVAEEVRRKASQPIAANQVRMSTNSSR